MGARSRLLLFPVLLVLLAIFLFSPHTVTPVVSDAPPNRVLARALDIETGRAQRKSYEQPVSSGVIYGALQASGEIDKRLALGRSPTRPFPPIWNRTQGCNNIFHGDDGIFNVRVNQDCSLRLQAETVVVANPKNSRNLIAGQNDARIGFNHCGYDWSIDGGGTWGDQIPPFFQFILADGHTADGCADPSATFDADGNAYIADILVNFNSPASALVAAKSNAGIGGAFYHTPKAVPYQTSLDFPLGVIANDNNPNILNDKPFIVADRTPSSPKKNNVYVSWTRYDLATGVGIGFHTPIYFSQSTDGGATWSKGIEISGANPATCTIFSGESNPNACDLDQGSDPIVGPDGKVYVSFFNNNTPQPGVAQHLVVSCPAAKDCSNVANWSKPSKINDDFAKQPFGPDSVTGCPNGWQCLPPNGYRISDASFGSLSVDSSNKLYHVFSDFRNGGGTCDWNNGQPGQAASAKPPCDQDVFYNFSIDGGVTWTSPFNLTPKSKFGPSAQWMPWSAVTDDGKVLWVAYYDRSYGNCETTGCNDITLARIRKPTSGCPTVSYKRLTTSSMPNLVVANNPVEAGFLGDYMWVSVDGDGHPMVIWTDTRGLNDTVEADIYFFGTKAWWYENEHEDNSPDHACIPSFGDPHSGSDSNQGLFLPFVTSPVK